MDRKYILLLILPRCFTVPVHDQDCVTYPFEEEFDVQFSSVYSECPEKWKLGNYNSNLKSPHILSRTFITPTNLLSCAVSYKFRMTTTGIVEVNLYMDTVSSDDFISIEVHNATSGSDTVVGEKTISSSSADFKIGWKTVKIPLSGFGNFNGYILLKGKTTDDSIVLIDSFRYIPPLYDKELCNIYDHSVYVYTEFYDLTTVENSPDIKTITEEPFVITEGFLSDLDSDEINKNTAYITHPDIAMNMLDSTTEFLNTSEQSTNIQTTQEVSDVTEVDITDTSQSTVMLNEEFPSTSQTILSTETSTHKTDTEWIDSILLDSTVETPKIEDAYASTLLLTTDSNYIIHSSTEQDTTISLPELLYDTITTNFKTNNTNMPDTHGESIFSSSIYSSITSKANIMDTELTTKLTSSTLTEGSNIKTTTEYVSYSATRDFIYPSTIWTKGSEFKDTSEISSTKQNLIKYSTDIDDIVMPLKRNKTIDKTDMKAIDIYTTRPTEADDGTLALNLEVKGNLTHPTKELTTLIKNEPVISTAGVQNKKTLQIDSQSETTTEIPEYTAMDNEFLANFSIYSIVSLFIIILILIIATFF